MTGKFHNHVKGSCPRSAKVRAASSELISSTAIDEHVQSHKKQRARSIPGISRTMLKKGKMLNKTER